MMADDDAAILPNFARRHNARQEDNRYVRQKRDSMDPLGKLASLHAGHADVEQDEIGAEFPRYVNRLLWIVEFPGFVATRPFDNQFCNTCGIDIVVDDQYAAFLHANC